MRSINVLKEVTGPHSISTSDVYIEYRQAMLREGTPKARPTKPSSHLTALMGVNDELGRGKRPREDISLEDMHVVT